MKKCPFCNEEMNDEEVVCPSCKKAVTEDGENGAETAEGKAEESKEEETKAEEGEAVSETEKVEESGAQPELVQPPVKKKGKLVVGGAVAAAIAAVGIFGGIKMMEKDPKDVVIDAFKGVYSSDITYPSEEIFGWDTIVKNSREKNMESGFRLALEQSSSDFANMFAGTAITSENKCDVENKKVYGKIGTKIANMDFLSMDVYADTEKIAIAVPELSSKVFSLDYANDLEGQMESSPVVGQMLKEAEVEPSVISDYMDYIWSFYGEKEEQPFDIEGLWNRYKEGSKAIDNFKTAMTVEKAEGASFTVNGKETQCRGYDVVISQEAMIDFVKTTSQFFMEDENLKKDVLEYLSQVVALSGGQGTNGMSAEDMQEEAWTTVQEYTDKLVAAMEESANDIAMTVYVDKKGNLAAFEAETNLTIDDSTENITLNAELQGGSYPTENAKVTLAVQDEETTVTLSAVKEGTYTKEALTEGMDITIEGAEDSKYAFSYDSDYNRTSGDYNITLAGKGDEAEGSLVMEGNVSNLKPGESFDIAMDTISVTWDGEELATLSGNYYIKPMEGEVSMPEGEEVDVLAATGDDWTEIGREAGENLQGISQTFQSFLTNIMMYMYMGGTDFQ